MWSTEASSTTAATPETIWALYENVEGWKEWDSGIVSSQLHGAFSAGSTGEMLNRGAPAPMTFTLGEVSAPTAFTDHTSLPGATITFVHTLEPTDGGTRITHRATIHGEAWERYAQIFGANLEHGVNEAVVNLARLAAR